MHYLDLDEIESLFKPYWLWSTTKKNLARFDRRNYLGDPNNTLKASVLKILQEKTGKKADKIYLLTNLSYFGYSINPISLYFCFQGDVLTHCVVEVTNTPWKEKMVYVTEPEVLKHSIYHVKFKKEMHVSPFLDMAYEYHLKFKLTQKKLILQLENWQGNRCDFDATLSLCSQPIDHKTLFAMLSRYPFITGKVFLAIRWQAFKLWWKGFNVFDHPKGKGIE